MEKDLIDILKASIEEQRKVNRRLFITILVLIFILLFTNISWLIYESQFCGSTDSTELYAEDSGLNVYGDNNAIKG